MKPRFSSRLFRALFYGVLISVHAWSATAHAGMYRHRVLATETLEGIARRYYGSSWKYIYIKQHNGLAGGALRAGSSLVIPESWTYKVRSGDTLARIAKRYLNSADRYQVLASANGMASAASLSLGQTLLMPFHLQHKVVAGDTLNKLARRYYRSGHRSERLRDYNHLKTTSLQVGQKLVIPIFDRSALNVSERAPKASRTKLALGGGAKNTKKSKQKRGPAPLNDLDIQAALTAADAAFRKGEYRKTRDMLIELIAGGVGREPDVYRMLGTCAVAIGDNNEAEGYFGRWLEMEPEATLDPIRTSPKVLRVFHTVRSRGP